MRIEVEVSLVDLQKWKRDDVTHANKNNQNLSSQLLLKDYILTMTPTRVKAKAIEEIFPEADSESEEE